MSRRLLGWAVRFRWLELVMATEEMDVVYLEQTIEAQIKYSKELDF